MNDTKKSVVKFLIDHQDCKKRLVMQKYWTCLFCVDHDNMYHLDDIVFWKPY